MYDSHDINIRIDANRIQETKISMHSGPESRFTMTDRTKILQYNNDKKLMIFIENISKILSCENFDDA